jgi:hypothetical protein
MARVALVCTDLLFGSNVEGALRAAGHEVTMCATAALPDAADVLVVDVAEFDPGRLPDASAARVGFYPHVDQELRKRALDAGFDVVVPRSRMARETAAVVERALADRTR